jgi:hypothetical protein
MKASPLSVVSNRFEDGAFERNLTARRMLPSSRTRSSGQNPVRCDADSTAGVPSDKLESTGYRLIGFDIVDEGNPSNLNPFRLAAEVKKSTDDMRTTKPKSESYKAFEPSTKQPAICVETPLVNGGVKETWVIVNESNELHNFHIHQVKFKVEEILELGTGVGAPISVLAGGFHDTFPINAKGRIKISIKFDRPEQLGRYFFHCHILEHEDRGMMARIQVIDSSNPPSAAGSVRSKSAQASNSIYGSKQALRINQSPTAVPTKVSIPSAPHVATLVSAATPSLRDRFGREIKQDVCLTPR